MKWSHIRRLSIVMRALEDAVLEIESAVEPASETPSRVMTAYDDDVPEPVKHAILAKLAEIRDEIRDAKDYYGLCSDRISKRERLSTKLLVVAIDLTECRSEYLRGYDEVSDEERGPLDERMSRLEAFVNEVNRLLLSGAAYPERP